MAPASERNDVTARATAVVAALSDLEGYLSAAVNPDRIALADLKMEPMGWTKHVYSKTAFDTWLAQLRLFPSDPLIRHHMAIMHHARAFDLEADSKPSESDADWEAAMEHWHQLYGMDAFWELLTAKACAGSARQDAVTKLRESFPQLVLAIHYDIALHKDTRDKRKSRAKFHIGMAQRAPFDARERAEAQRAAYNRYIQVVPDEVWQPRETREEVLDKGQKAIVEYLDLDPGCIPALEDALRLQRRVQQSRNTLWRSLDENDPKRLALLQLEKKDAERWRPFFDQLINVVDELDEEVRDDLARWYRGRGSDLSAMKEHEKAIEFYERAVRVCRRDSDDQREHTRSLVQEMAMVARNKAEARESSARSYCERIAARTDLSIIACYVLAGAYMRLADQRSALALCDRGLAIEPDFDDLEADEWLAQLATYKKDIPLISLLSQANEALKAAKPNVALRPLDEAETLAKEAGTLRDHNDIYWLRAQAHLALDRIAEAKRDTELYLGLLDRNSSPTDIEAGKELQRMVAAKDTAQAIHRLLETAKGAMEAGRFKDALNPLNAAARAAPQAQVVFFLRAQALLATGDIAAARRDVQTMAALAESADDRDAAKRLSTMIEEGAGQAAIGKLVVKAREAMEQRAWRRAEGILDEAQRLAPNESALYFLRAQARMGSGDRSGAFQDTMKFASLARSAEEREAADRLKKALFGI